MTTIGIISDTHIRAGGKRQLPPRVFDDFNGVSLILHGGDLTSEHVLTDLETIAPVLAVYGNNDGWELTARLPQARRIPVEDCIIGLTHGDLSANNQTVRPLEFAGNRYAAAQAWSHFEHDGDISCVVFGHSHRSLCAWHEVAGKRVLMFNPGSPTDKRYGPHYSLGLLRVDGRKIEGEIISW
jgi:putative phosphoesterase